MSDKIGLKGCHRDNELMVEYDGKRVEYGMVLRKDETQKRPKVKLELEKGKMYSLIMVDPDAPSPKDPVYRYYLHWLIVNIKKNEDGMIVNEYKGPAPPSSSGKHRYYISLFEQKEVINLSEMERPKFNLEKFIEKYESRLVGCTKYEVIG